MKLVKIIYWRPAILLLFALFVTSCVTSSNPSSGPAKEPEPKLEIGLLLPGPAADDNELFERAISLVASKTYKVLKCHSEVSLAKLPVEYKTIITFDKAPPHQLLSLDFVDDKNKRSWEEACVRFQFPPAAIQMYNQELREREVHSPKNGAAQIRNDLRPISVNKYCTEKDCKVDFMIKINPEKADVQKVDDKNSSSGNLTRTEIEAVIRANMLMIRACYEREWQRNKDLEGRVITDFTIGSSGRVERSEITNLSTPKLESVSTCIRMVVLTWHFPQPRYAGKVTVKYPFILKR